MMFLRNMWHLIIIVAISAAYGSNVYANDVLRSPKVEVQPHLLKIAIPEIVNNPVFSEYQDLIKFMRWFWLDWAKKYHYKVEFIAYPIENMQGALDRNEVDIVATGAYEKGKKTKYLYSIPYITLNPVLYEKVSFSEDDTTVTIEQPSYSHPMSSGNNNYRKIFPRADLLTKDKTITVHQPYFVETRLGERIKRKVIKNEKALFSYSSDYIWSWSPPVANQAFLVSAQKNRYVQSEKKIPAIVIRTITRKNNRQLTLDINDGIRKSGTQRTRAMWAKYVSLDNNYFNLLVFDYEKNLNKTFQELILDNPVWDYGYVSQGDAPYVMESDLTLSGYYIDYLQALSEKIGVSFVGVRYDSFFDALLAVKKDKIDLLPGIYKTPKRTIDLGFTSAIDKVKLAIVSVDNYSQIADLKGKRVAAIRGFHENTVLRHHLPNAKLIIFNSPSEAIAAVAHHKVDAYLGNILNSAHLVASLQFSNLQINKITEIKDDLSLRIASAKKHSNRINLINFAITKLGDEFQKELHLGWQQRLLTVREKSVIDDILERVVSIGLFLLFVFIFFFGFYQHQLKAKREQQEKIEKALKESEQAKKEAQQLAKSKSDFLARMSHEIRTPMNGVLGMAEALAYTNLSAEQDDLLNTLNSSARNMMALLNDVLDFSKMDAGKLSLEMMPTDLNAILHAVMDNFRHKAKAQGVELKLLFDEKIETSYIMDGTRLMQIVNNLVSNALKFTQQGFVDVRVQLIDCNFQPSTENLQHLIQIEISDNGIGIAKDKVSSLFTPFVQAEENITRKYGGTGLGLSICKEIVNAMDGEICVSSLLGLGSVFSISLPLTVLDLVPAIEDSDKVEFDTQYNCIAQLSILLVEDNAINRKVIEGQLKRIGVTRLDTAINGIDALAKYNNGHYDVVISDCHMPEMDGFALAGELCAIKQHSKPWIIALTAEALSGAATRCYDAGFDDYLSKPCPLDLLEKKLLNAIRKLDLTPVESVKETPDTSLSDLNNINGDEIITNNDYLHLDTKQLNRMNANDHQLVLMIANAFLENTLDDQQQLLSIFIKKDWAQLKSTAHRIKGSVLYMGAQSLGDLAFQVEQKAFVADKSLLSSAVEQLAEGLSILEVEVRSFVLSQSKSEESIS